MYALFSKENYFKLVGLSLRGRQIPAEKPEFEFIEPLLNPFRLIFFSQLYKSTGIE